MRAKVMRISILSPWKFMFSDVFFRALSNVAVYDEGSRRIFFL